MSYNGIGLQTPRGSGTSGYVQKNEASKKSEGIREKRRREAADEHRKLIRAKMAEARRNAGDDVRAHDQKRRIEVKCMELRESLEEQDLDDSEIDKRVASLRSKMLAEEKILHDQREKLAKEDLAASEARVRLEKQQYNEDFREKSQVYTRDAKSSDPRDRRTSNREFENETIQSRRSSVDDSKLKEPSPGPLYNYIPRSTDR
ncbi:hypothetical protein JCM33374_g2095 [Metschnikowia sp. JCM 33374]|nr:hypothetical protein JCM33374_g2095 [Metschnikowia sp. JCM 33374]